MKLLQNKIFIAVVCVISFILSGFILADRVLGVSNLVQVASVFNMSGKIITNVGTPLGPTDAATKSWVESRGIILENRTSDPSGAAVGQMWICVDAPGPNGIYYDCL